MPALRTRDTRSLEVTTDSPPQAPTLAIVSPTPRAFTFPSTHNLADSPYSSPSSSPFEPDLLPLSLRSNSPLQLAPPPSTSPRPLTHQRRKSSVCSITDDELQRRPRKGDSDYIKRPENAFILFRRKCCEDRQAVEDSKQDGPTKRQRQADLSKTISQQWKSLSPEERKVWEDKAKERKKEHEALYPNYVYRPQRTKDKAKAAPAKKTCPLFKGVNRSQTTQVDTDIDSPDSTSSLSIVIPMGTSRHHGRSASVPTPPPYQSIVLPNLYSGVTSSCRTSPSLLPMITRRASMNHHHHLDDGVVNNFDFLPNDHFMPPPPPPIPNAYADQTPTAASTGFEAIQSSDFLRDIFSMHNISNPNDIYPQPALHLNSDNHLSASPASSIGSSSGPSSPSAGPFTPLSALPHPTVSSSTSYAQDVSTLEYQTELFPQQDLSSYPWDTTSIWPTGVPSFEGDGSSHLLLGDDFDLNAIPPIELGSCGENGKFGGGGNELDDPSTTGSALQFGQDFTNALGFDEMMAGCQRY